MAIQQTLASLKCALPTKLDLSALHSRNPTAHKWKAPYRSLQLREVVYWRMLDLLIQSLILHKQDHALGARILLRSALETLAILICLNQQMGKVLEGKVAFPNFSKKTEALLLGSRNGNTPFNAVNILTVFDECDKQYAGIRKMYDDLSESAHPNYDGMSRGYAEIDRMADTVSFTNRWADVYSEKHPDAMMLCIEIFEHEYNTVWPQLFEQLEKWIEKNDAELEATKDDSPSAVP
jgi:hypothetical protein